MKKKDFDAVKMMRDIRTKLSDRYRKDPAQEQKDLSAISRKYGIPQAGPAKKEKTA